MRSEMDSQGERSMNIQASQIERGQTHATRIKIACGTVSITLLMVAGLFSASPGALASPLGLLQLALFAVLTGWIAFGFCVAMSGTWRFLASSANGPVTHNGECQPHAKADEGNALDLFDSDRIALLVPIYNEDPAAVMACIQATAESLGRTDQSARFDIFILSDTTQPEVWVREEILWSTVRAEIVGPAPSIHYRHRVENRGRKAGNIGEFLERWGLDYKYFVILDADSTMDGETLVELARRMDQNDRLGILQAPPIPEGRESLWARAQQFSARAYGPLFNFGLVAWTSGDGNYWGHNAMIRCHAFLRHCGLSKLPGPEPLGGEVLSHDFVEAALMRRAGFEVRLAADLGGGYEQCPTTVEDHARRDQRWCQGNMQHLRIAVAPAWHPVSRLHLLSGAMSYLASPLWLFFLLGGVALHFVNSEKTNGTAAISVFLAAMVMLLLPKLMSVAIHIVKGATSFGGGLRLLASMLTESLVSMAVAPVMMLYHSRFTMLTLMGRKVRWNAQVRTDDGMSFVGAVRIHGVQTLIGLAAAAGLYFYAPTLIAWASPILFGLIFSIPIGKVLASPAAGRFLKRCGLLLTPEETNKPRLLRRRDILYREYELVGTDLAPNESLFGRVLKDPRLYRLHQSLLLASASPPATSTEVAKKVTNGTIRKARKFIRRRGIESIPVEYRRDLLSNSEALRQLHLEHWARVESAA